jgi:predicted Zn-dependent peptidase
VNTAGTLERMRKYFEPIPSQPAPPPVDVKEAPQEKERRLTLEDPLARLARLDISYRIPSNLSPDNDTIETLSLVLAGGRSARFYEDLVRQKQLAVQINAFAPDSRGPRLLKIIAIAAPGKPLAELEQAIYADIENLKTGTIAEAEIEKARNAARRQLVGDLGSSLTRAFRLSDYALVHDDPGMINTSWERLARLKAADVQRVAKQYLTPENRSVIVTTPKPAAGRGGLQ